jgi:hypothetical protein
MTASAVSAEHTFIPNPRHSVTLNVPKTRQSAWAFVPSNVMQSIKPVANLTREYELGIWQISFTA